MDAEAASTKSSHGAQGIQHRVREGTVAESSNTQSSLGSQIFRETALRKMSSADDLDRYLQVTNPSAWVLIGAVAALLIAALIWGCTASLPITASTIGVVKNGEIVCFLPLDESTMVRTDSKVTAAGRETYIKSVDDNPFSQREVSAAIGSDYTVESLRLAQWSYKIIVVLPDDLASWEEGDDVPLQFTTKEVAPLSYLFGGAQS